MPEEEWKAPEPITDARYREMLLELLGVEDPADPAHAASIEKLEHSVLMLDMNLPIVRRIVPASTEEPREIPDNEPTGTWGQTDKGIEFFDEPIP